MQEQDRIIKINIEEEMKSSYIDYSMSNRGTRPPGCERWIQTSTSPYPLRNDGTGKYFGQTL